MMPNNIWTKRDDSIGKAFRNTLVYIVYDQDKEE